MPLKNILGCFMFYVGQSFDIAQFRMVLYRHERNILSVIAGFTVNNNKTR